MSPTSYQTAPPRSLILPNHSDRVNSTAYLLKRQSVEQSAVYVLSLRQALLSNRAAEESTGCKTGIREVALAIWVDLLIAPCMYELLGRNPALPWRLCTSVGTNLLATASRESCCCRLVLILGADSIWPDSPV